MEQGLRGWRRAGAPWRAIALSVALATAAQLAPVVWRLEGHAGGYYGTVDEMFYASLVRRAAATPPTTTDPFDREWRQASSPYGWMLPQLVGLPLRLGVPPGLWSDLSRWAASATGAYLLIRVGAAVASPAVGAAAATLALLDPGTYYGKPLVLLFTGRWAAFDAESLPMSRLYTPSFLLPFFAGVLLVLVRSAGPRGRRPSAAVAVGAFAALGLAGYFFYWTTALACAVAVVLVRPRRQAVLRWLIPAGLAMLLLVALNGVGSRDDLVEHALRIGFIRTSRPVFLAHAGFWLAAAVAALLALAPWRVAPSARALGIAAVGAWALVLVHTPITGWDVQSHHYDMALGPLSALTYSAAAWYGWRHWARRSRWLSAAGCVLVAGAALLGPWLALRGLAAAGDQPAIAWENARRLAALGGVPPEGGVQIAVPRPARFALTLALPNTPYWYPFLEAWGVSDTALFTRTVCAALLTGEDSAETLRRATPRDRFATVWPDGRPADVSLAGVRSYFALMPVLAGREAGAVARLAHEAPALRGSCAVLPDFALALGHSHVRRAGAVAAALDGRTAWVARDSSAAWFRFLRGTPGP
jgi:hypothetical protein